VTPPRSLIVLALLSGLAVFLMTKVPRSEEDSPPALEAVRASDGAVAALARLVPNDLARGCDRTSPHPSPIRPASARELARVECSLTGGLDGTLTVARYPTKAVIAERVQEWRDYLPDTRGTCVTDVGDTGWVDRDGHDRGVLVCGYTTDYETQRTTSFIVWTDDRSRTVWELESELELAQALRRWNEVVRPMTLHASVRERRLFALMDFLLSTKSCHRDDEQLPLAVAQVACEPPRRLNGKPLAADLFVLAWMSSPRHAQRQLDTFSRSFAEFTLPDEEYCGDAHLSLEPDAFGPLLCFPSGEHQYLVWRIRGRPLFFLAAAEGSRVRALVNAYDNQLGLIW
jgi:hypothetical protein